MDRHAGGPRDLGRAAHGVERDRGAAAAVVRVLEADQRGARGRAGLAHESAQLGGVDPAARVVLGAAEADAAQRRGADGLLAEDVRLGADDGLVAAAAVHEQRDEVRHGAAGDVERGPLADALGGGVLQALHGGVVAEHVVADLGARHRLAHRLAGAGDGVRSQVDDHILEGLSVLRLRRA